MATAPGGSESGFMVGSDSEVDATGIGRTFVAIDPDGRRLRVQAMAVRGA